MRPGDYHRSKLALCKNCFHFKPTTENALTGVQTGECRAMPPQSVQTMDGYDVLQAFTWPLVRDADWCGYFDWGIDWEATNEDPF